MFQKNIRINFYHCDPAGILFYARLFEICHSAYEEMIKSFNLKDDYWQNEEFVVPIIKTNAEYFFPLKAGNEISIETKVTQLKDNSFELTYGVKNEAARLCASVKTVHVFVDKKSWKKKKIPSDILAGLLKHK